MEAFGRDEAVPFTHVFLQGGVGGLAAGILSYFWECYGERRPTVVIVEPVQADCLFQSALRGVASKATGSVDSVMAGLACGEASPLAWRFLVSGADYFMTITDDDAVAAMRLLAIGNISLWFLVNQAQPASQASSNSEATRHKLQRLGWGPMRACC